jgi:serine/threonine protein kinase
MFNNTYNYNINLFNSDQSLHDGVPKIYHHLKDKKFSDWEIPPWELFIFTKRLLGEGSFAKVYLAKWRGTFVVAKVINANICANEKNLVLREFDIMTKMHHPNIVQFLGYIDDPFIIVMEYIPKGDLLENIEKKTLNKSQKINIMKDILQGLAYIHNRKPYSLIHRDIKPTNILLTNSKVAKITDFGLSKFANYYRNNSNDNLVNLDNSTQINQTELSKKLIEDLTSFVGTERYMAPECVNDNNYSNKVDIYSCGILLYEMFENKRYIPNTKMVWYNTPKNIRNIINEKMLNVNPEERSDALNLLELLNKL